MILYIDTTDFGEANFVLEGKLGKKQKTFAAVPQESFKILEFLEKFLKQEKVSMQALKKIVLLKGQGSFTGLRVGAAIASGLSLGLNIPVKIITKK